jgi:hypothetical protein
VPTDPAEYFKELEAIARYICFHHIRDGVR